MSETVQPKEKVVEHPPKQEGIFDHRTHILNSVTGRLVNYQPCATHCNGDIKIHERPIGSGNMFSPNDTPLGRYEKIIEGGQFRGNWKKISEEHIATKPIPINKQEHYEQENEDLRSELAAIKAEREGTEAVTVEKAPAKDKGQKS